MDLFTKIKNKLENEVSFKENELSLSSLQIPSDRESEDTIRLQLTALDGNFSEFYISSTDCNGEIELYNESETKSIDSIAFFINMVAKSKDFEDPEIYINILDSSNFIGTLEVYFNYVGMSYHKEYDLLYKTMLDPNRSYGALWLYLLALNDYAWSDYLKSSDLKQMILDGGIDGLGNLRLVNDINNVLADNSICPNNDDWKLIEKYLERCDDNKLRIEGFRTPLGDRIKLEDLTQRSIQTQNNGLLKCYQWHLNYFGLNFFLFGTPTFGLD